MDVPTWDSPHDQAQKAASRKVQSKEPCCVRIMSMMPDIGGK